MDLYSKQSNDIQGTHSDENIDALHKAIVIVVNKKEPGVVRINRRQMSRQFPY